MLGGLLVWTAVRATLIAVPSLYGVGYLHDTILPVALQLVVSGLMAVVRRGSASPPARSRGGWSSPTSGRCASCAATPFTPSCSPPRCRCWCWRRWTASCRRRNRKPTAATACTKRSRRSTSTSAPTSTITSMRCSRWPSALTTLAGDDARRQQLLDAVPRRLSRLHHAVRRRSARHRAARSSRRATPSRRRSAIASTSSAPCGRGRLAISDVILGRLSYVPIVTIAVPIFDAAGAVAGVAGGSLDLSKFEQFVEDFRTLPNARITVARSALARDLHQRRDQLHRAAEPRRRTTWSSASAQAAQRRVPLRAQDGGRQRVGAARGVGGDGADRLEGVHRAAAGLHPPAVDRLLRVRARR